MGKEEEDRGNTPDAGIAGSAPAEGETPPGVTEGEEHATNGTLTTTGAEPGSGDEEFDEIDVEGEKVKIKKATSDKLQKRFNNYSARTRKAEEEAAYWRGVAQGRQGQPEGSEQPGAAAPVVSGPPSLPDPTDYAQGIYDPAYVADHDKYIIEVAEHRVEERRELEKERSRVSEVHNTFMSRMKEAEKEDPEVANMFSDPTFFPNNRPEAGPIISVIKESDKAPKILSYLYSHRDELDSLYRMSPLAAAREIGRLESKFMVSPSTPTKKVSQAPAPVKTVGGGGASAVIEDEDKIPTEEFMKRRNKAQFGKA